jgi:long-chain acyl-CoA synthetase
MFTAAATLHAHRPCLGHRPISPTDGSAGPYVWESYGSVLSRATHLSAALSTTLAPAPVSPGDAVGVYGSNAPAWMLAMQACNRTGARCVPLYDTLGDEAVRFVLAHAGAAVVFCGADKLGALATALTPGRPPHPVAGTPVVHTIIVWGTPAGSGVGEEALSAAAATTGARVVSFEAFEAAGAAVSPLPLPAPATAADICTIMYTSGTTGDPKGVLISHGAVLTTVAGQRAGMDQMGGPMGERFTPDDVMLSYLPLAHIFDRALEELFLAVGGRIGYWRGRIDGVLDDIQALRPTLFIGVPRVFDRVYAGVQAQLARASPLRRAIFSVATWHKARGLAAGLHWGAASPLADALVFSKVKARLGGRTRLVVSGSAPLAPKVEAFLRVAMCCPVLQGYGLTETCSSSFVAPPSADQAGRVGGPLPLLHMCLESVPDMGYDATATPPRGEVLIRGPTVFAGYYRDAEQTAAVLDPDGWFHTGDVGEVRADGSLRLIDRKKALFKLAQGEYISPERVEAALAGSGLVEQVWVTGDSLAAFPVAVAVPREDALRKLLASTPSIAKLGALPPASAGCEALCEVPGAAAAVAAALAAAAAAAGLRPFEVPRAVALEPEAWTPEGGLMTPTFKLKRPALGSKYKAVVSDLYAGVEDAPVHGL